jgi:hypothetical protein
MEPVPPPQAGTPTSPKATRSSYGAGSSRPTPSATACCHPLPYGESRGRVAQLLRGGSWFNEPHNCRAANRNSNHPGNTNTNIGVRPCCLLPPAPFTVRTVGRDSSGSTRRVQTRSGDRWPRRSIRTSSVHCPRPHDLAGSVGLSSWTHPAKGLPNNIMHPTRHRGIRLGSGPCGRVTMSVRPHNPHDDCA